MSTFLKNSGSNISVLSKGSSNEKTNQHKYFTRSSVRKYRNPYSIDNREPIVYLTPLKCFDNGCAGDIHLQVQQYKLYEKDSEKLDSRNPLTVQRMNQPQRRIPTTVSKTIKFLKYGVFIGLTGLLVANILENFVGQNTAIHDIKEDLKKVTKKVGDLDEKINNIIQNGTNSVLVEIKELFKDQNRINFAHNPKFYELRKAKRPTLQVFKIILVINNVPNLDYIKQLVKDALSKYDADKTGQTDFALESSGGAIVSIKNTENYVRGAPTLTLFGIPLCSGSNSPRTIIQPSTLPGECWAFKGNVGTAIIKLLGRVIISGVSLEHIPASISPTGELKTAPKEFSIWGLSSETDTEGGFLGQFIYNISGPSVQYFPINNSYKAYNYVEFKVLSNHGNSEYTCVYRLRVHGKLDGPRL